MREFLVLWFASLTAGFCFMLGVTTFLGGFYFWVTRK